jgi:recombination protein RecT
MTTVSDALAKRETGPGALVQQYRQDFADVLPSHVNAKTWIRLATGLLRRDEKLNAISQRNPGSLMQALLECARLGHEPGTESFYLVPMGNEIEGWEGYRGVVERMYRAGAISSVKAELVKANDGFRFDPSNDERPSHTVDWFGERGDTLGAYAYAVMQDGGTSKVVVIGKDYIEKVKKESRGSSNASSPWVKWTDAMILKTVIHRLEPFVPTSSEYRRAALRDVATVAAEISDKMPPRPDLPAPAAPAGVDVETGEITDAELVDDAVGLDGSKDASWPETPDVPS